MPFKPNAIVELEFLASDKGGRRGPLPRDTFGCPLVLDGRDYFDCRLDLTGVAEVKPGDRIVVPIGFLSPQLVVGRLYVGKDFTLWEMRTIALGKVVEVLS